MPVDIKGNFVDVKPGFLDYCITKGKKEVAISRNQVGLGYACYNEACDEAIALNKRGILEVNNGEEFSLYLNINCVNNLQTADFTINHTGFDYIGFRKAWDHKPSVSRPHQIYGDLMFEGSNPENKAFFSKTSCGDSCTMLTISHAGLDGPTGSDALVELVFNAISGPGLHIITISDVNLVDASISDIPPSKQDIEVLIK